MLALLVACSMPVHFTGTTNTPDITLTPSPALASPSPSASSSPSLTLTSTPTIIASLTLTPSQTLSPSPVPTYAILRGEVLELANCRYGPGVPYLYKYGLVPGSRLEIIGRNDAGTWVYVQAIGGHNPCWVNARVMKIQGDIMSVEPIYPDKAKLPVSPYYPPPAVTSVTRNGDQVTITWVSKALRPGDRENENSPLFVVEVWTCQQGRIVFTPIGAYQTQVTVTDEPGCSEPSHGRVFLAEKHGYAGPAEIPWPAHLMP